MDHLHTDFARLASLTFGGRGCYFGLWKRGDNCFECQFGIPEFEQVRKSIESLWLDLEKVSFAVGFSGKLDLQFEGSTSEHIYQVWKFEMPFPELSGMLLFIDLYPTEKPQIGDLEIRPWLDFLKSNLECSLSKNSENEAAVFKAILDNSSEMIVLIDPNHKVLEFNEFAFTLLEEFFGVHIKKGQDYRDFVLPQILETYLSGFQAALNGERFLKELNLGSSLQSYWFEFCIFPVLNLSGDLIGVCLKGTDITAEKRANLELKSLAEIFNALNENLNESVAILDKEYRILRHNTRIKRRLELNTGKVLKEGSDFREFLYYGSEELFNQNFQKALKGELIETEGTFSSKNQEKIWIRTRFIPIFLENSEVSAVGILVKNIQEEKMLELALKESEEKFRKIVSTAAMAILITDQDMNITTVNPEVSRLFGYSEQELVGQHIRMLIPIRYHEAHSHHQNRYARSPVPMRMMEDRNTKALRKNGDEIDVEVSLNSFTLGEETYFMAMILDVTEKNKLSRLLENTSQLALTGNWEYTFFQTGEESLYWSPMTKRIFDVPEEYIPKYGDLDLFFKDESGQILQESIEKLQQTGQGYDLELKVITMKGEKKWVRAIGTMEKINGDGLRIYGSVQDITEKKLNEIELIQSLQSVKNYKEAIEKSSYVLVTGLDGNIIDVNDSWCKLTEYRREELIGASSNITKSDYHPESFFEELWFTIRSGNIWKGEIRDISKNGNYFWVDTTIVPMKNEKGEVYQYITIRNDITEKKAAVEELEVRARELSRSNAELEQFAFVASHDLQEPLRMVTSFLTLLKRKHSANLNESANKYIDYAVEGALRMRSTILDLLSFSRIGKSGEGKEELKMDRLVEEVMILQKKSIEESKARIEFENLPVLFSYKVQLLLVLGNLISNSIKYRRPDHPPVIKINSEDMGPHWYFSVSDNGIGFNMEYSEKIFVIFQRLHSRANYQGNGIGLAIVRKVLENLNGKIWVESEENVGTTFHFILPK